MNIDDYVFHYTDAYSIFQIASRRTLWATHVEYMNDRREGQIAKIFGERYCNALGSSERDEFTKEVFSCFVRSSRHCFFISFSERYDNLSMYRTYAPLDGGYCIGFKKQFLREVPNLELIECEYDEKFKVHSISEFMGHFQCESDKRKEFFDSALEVSNDIRRSTQLASEYTRLSESFKATEFENEEEWRLISRQYDRRELRTSSKGHILIPYVEVDLLNVDTEVFITLGPNSNMEMASKSIQDLPNIAKKHGTKWDFRVGAWDMFGYRSF